MTGTARDWRQDGCGTADGGSTTPSKWQELDGMEGFIGAGCCAGEKEGESAVAGAWSSGYGA